MFKNGCETQANITPFRFNRIFEKVMYNRLKAYLYKQGIFVNHSMASAIIIPLNMPFLT